MSRTYLSVFRFHWEDTQLLFYFFCYTYPGIDISSAYIVETPINSYKLF